MKRCCKYETCRDKKNQMINTGVGVQITTDEGQQIQLIIDKCGAINDKVWEGVQNLHLYHQLLGPLRTSNQGSKLRQYFRDHQLGGEPQFLDMIEKLLSLDPSKRMTARQALKHPFFQQLPLPCKPSELPKIEGEAHEMIVSQEKKKQQQMKQQQHQSHQFNQNANQSNQYGDRQHNYNYQQPSHNKNEFYQGKNQIQFIKLLNNQYIESRWSTILIKHDRLNSKQSRLRSTKSPTQSKYCQLPYL